MVSRFLHFTPDKYKSILWLVPAACRSANMRISFSYFDFSFQVSHSATLAYNTASYHFTSLNLDVYLFTFQSHCFLPSLKKSFNLLCNSFRRANTHYQDYNNKKPNKMSTPKILCRCWNRMRNSQWITIIQWLLCMKPLVFFFSSSLSLRMASSMFW